MQPAKRLGKFFGDLEAVFPSTGEFAPGTGETLFPNLGNIRRDMHLAATAPA